MYTSGESGGLQLRYTSVDAKADALAHRNVLEAAGYTISDTEQSLDLSSESPKDYSLVKTTAR